MLTDFAKGLIIGVVASALVFGVISVLFFNKKKEKEIIKYVEIQQEIEALREDYSNRDPLEFVDSVPGVRGSVDGAIGDFTRKRDEALQRFRSGIAD